MYASRPKTAGRVSIHSSEPLEDLLDDSEWTSRIVKRKAQRSKSAGCISNQSLAETRRSARDSKSVAFDNKSWLSEKSAKNIQEKAESESGSVRHLYNSLLENETDIQEDVEDFLSENERLQRRKKYLLFKDWRENVYSPLKGEIDKEMNSDNYRNFDKRKRNLYSQYLRYANRKGDVYLDTMSFDEYDPLSINGHRPGPLKAVTKKRKDPLPFQERKRNDEDRAVMACSTGLTLSDRELEEFRLPPLPLVPLGRHGTEWKDLLEIELGDIHSEARQRSQKRMPGCLRYKTNIDFEAWRNMPPGIVDKEHRPHRKQFFEKHQSTLLLT